MISGGHNKSLDWEQSAIQALSMSDPHFPPSSSISAYIRISHPIILSFPFSLMQFTRWQNAAGLKTIIVISIARDHNNDWILSHIVAECWPFFEKREVFSPK